MILVGDRVFFKKDGAEHGAYIVRHVGKGSYGNEEVVSIEHSVDGQFIVCGADDVIPAILASRSDYLDYKYGR